MRGIAETNARIEVRQNQQLIYSSTVSPGSFVIDDLYPTGYGGDLEVSVIEADGRRREFRCRSVLCRRCCAKACRATR